MALAQLEQEIESCSFVSFDTEFTGLGEERPSHLDTPSDRYRTAREYSRSFPPLQFGLTLFREIEHIDEVDERKDASVEEGEVTEAKPGNLPENKESEVKEPVWSDDNRQHPPNQGKVAMWEMLPFNFWLCPRALYRTRRDHYPIRDRIMQVQASTIDFLCRNGFDFQKSFCQGVSWMRHDDETSARAELVASYKPPRPYVPKMDKRETNVVEKFVKRVQEWLDKEDTKVGSSTFFALSEFNVNRIYLIRKAEIRFPNLVATIIDGGRKIGLPPSLRVEVFRSKKKAGEKRRQDHKQNYLKNMETTMRDAIGFRCIIDVLLKVKKPLVVHHGLFDTTKLMANFIGELPETLSGFKRMLKLHFPVIWDTRVLLVNTAYKYPWLSNLLTTEQGRQISGIIHELRAHKDDVPALSLRVLPKWDFERYDGANVDQFSHEAGFDALQTGRLLLYLISIALKRSAKAEDIRNACEHEKLGPLHNLMYLGSCGGYTDIALNKPASVDASPEEEEAVEDLRNKWMLREDVLVMSGVEDEESKRLEGWEIPYPFYRRVLEDLFEGTSYCGRESTVLPSADGVCIFIPKKARSNAEPARKRPRTNGIEKCSGDDSRTTSTATAPPCAPVNEKVEADDCSDESGMSEEDKRKIVEAAKERGIVIRTYKEALRTGKTWRMRFVL